MPTAVARFSARLALLLAIPSLMVACLQTNGSIPTDTGSGGNAGGTPGVGGNGGAAGSGGTGGSAGAGGAGPEDCLNGKDDNGDGLADCGDPTCNAGYECVPAIPQGWEAVWVNDVPYDPTATAPNCPDGMPPAVRYADPATTGTCSTCGCEYTGATCSAPGFACNYFFEDCYQAGAIPKFVDTNCREFVNVPYSENGGSCIINEDPDVILKGMCTGAPSTMEGPPAWARALQTCPVPAATGGGCAAQQVCVAKPSGDYANASTCVQQSNGGACPEGWTTTTIAAFDNGDDQRTCGDCACDVNTVKCTGGSYTIYDFVGCDGNGKSQVYDTKDECLNVTGIFEEQSASVRATLGTPMPGQCTQPTVQGQVVTTEPRTFCCR